MTVLKSTQKMQSWTSFSYYCYCCRTCPYFTSRRKVKFVCASSSFSFSFSLSLSLPSSTIQRGDWTESGNRQEMIESLTFTDCLYLLKFNEVEHACSIWTTQTIYIIHLLKFTQLWRPSADIDDRILQSSFTRKSKNKRKKKTNHEWWLESRKMWRKFVVISNK